MPMSGSNEQETSFSQFPPGYEEAPPRTTATTDNSSSSSSNSTTTVFFHASQPLTNSPPASTDSSFNSNFRYSPNASQQQAASQPSQHPRSSSPPQNARDLASFCYKTGEDRRVQPMCFDQGEVLLLEPKALGLKKEGCSKNQRLQIQQKKENKTVITITSVEIWLLTADGKPKVEQDVTSIFKFRCIEENDELFILVEKSGIPIVYGNRPPDRNKDPSALYLVRINFRRPNMAYEHVDFSLHKKQRSTVQPKKRPREEDGLPSGREVHPSTMQPQIVNNGLTPKKENDERGPHHQFPAMHAHQFHPGFQQPLGAHFQLPPQIQIQHNQLLQAQQYIHQMQQNGFPHAFGSYHPSLPMGPHALVHSHPLHALPPQLAPLQSTHHNGPHALNPFLGPLGPPSSGSSNNSHHEDSSAVNSGNSTNVANPNGGNSTNANADTHSHSSAPRGS